MAINMVNVTRLLAICLALNCVNAMLHDQSVKTIEKVQRATTSITPAKYEPTNPKNPLGKGFYVPNIDVFSEITGGAPIFSTVYSNCLGANAEDQQTRNNVNFYANTEKFYDDVVLSRSLPSALKGKFTMGTTLGVKTSSLSTGSIDVSGNSLRMWTYTQASALSCVAYSKLSSDVTAALDGLPLEIIFPENIASWVQYEQFFSTFGSHVVTKVYYGSSIRQWTFAKKSKNYSERQFLAAACANFEGASKVGQLGVDACTGLTSQEISAVPSYEMKFNVDIQGGTDTTRNDLLNSRSQALLGQLMTEGRQSPAPIDYEFVGIWDIIRQYFSGTSSFDQQMRAKADKFQQFYEGFKDFGCTKVTINGVIMRYFREKQYSTNRYECWMEKEGCRVNTDCHLGGGGTVSYCYGNTCMKHVSPAFGSKAKTAVAQTSKTGSYREGVNRSCYYSWGGAKCKNSFTAFPIWQF